MLVFAFEFFEKLKNTTWWGNTLQLKNTDYIVDNKILITKLSFKGTFPIKSTLVDIIF